MTLLSLMVQSCNSAGLDGVELRLISLMVQSCDSAQLDGADL